MIQGYHRSMRLQRKHEEFLNPFSFILGYPKPAKSFDSVFHNTDMIIIPYCHGTRKKSWKINRTSSSSKILTFEDFSSTGVFSGKWDFISENFFSGNFLGGYYKELLQQDE